MREIAEDGRAMADAARGGRAMSQRLVAIAITLASTSLLPGCCLFDALLGPPLCENCGGATVQNEDDCRRCCSGLANVEGYVYAGPGQCRCEGSGAGECD